MFQHFNLDDEDFKIMILKRSIEIRDSKNFQILVPIIEQLQVPFKIKVSRRIIIGLTKVK